MSKSIAERIEALEGPCREMDAEIYSALNPHMKPVAPVAKYRGRFFDPSKTTNIAAQGYHISGGATGIAPRYTSSLDAAMTLVPEGMMFTISSHDSGKGRGAASIFYRNKNGDRVTACQLCVASTPALALCAAALRAQEATNG